MNQQEFHENYPDVTLIPVNQKLFVIKVPDTPIGKYELSQIKKNINLLEIPSLYGLNAEPNLEDTNITFFHNYAFGELRGKGVIIGFIDTGIDYRNTLFQYEDRTTRILNIWDQTGKAIHRRFIQWEQSTQKHK